MLASGKQLVEAMLQYDKILKIHLMEEEEIVIPMLLACTPEEMDDFEKSTLQELTRKLKAKEKAAGVKVKNNKKLSWVLFHLCQIIDHDLFISFWTGMMLLRRILTDASPNFSFIQNNRCRRWINRHKI